MEAWLTDFKCVVAEDAFSCLIFNAVSEQFDSERKADMEPLYADVCLTLTQMFRGDHPFILFKLIQVALC